MQKGITQTKLFRLAPGLDASSRGMAKLDGYQTRAIDKFFLVACLVWHFATRGSPNFSYQTHVTNESIAALGQKVNLSK